MPAGSIANLLEAVLLPKVATMVSLSGDATVLVVTVKLALVAPDAMVTLDGQVAFESAPDRETVMPAEPAGPVKVITPFVD